MNPPAIAPPFPFTQKIIKVNKLPAWEENLLVLKNLRLKATVSPMKVSKKITWIYTTKNDVTITISPNRNIFAKVHCKSTRHLPIRFLGKNVEICGVLTLSKDTFDKTISKGRKWIARLNHELKGRKKHSDAYKPGGFMQDYVFCSVKGKHIPLLQYLTLVTAPLVLWEMIKTGKQNVNEVTISERDFKKCQKVSIGFDHKLSPAALKTISSNVNFQIHLQQHIQNLTSRQLLKLTQLAYYIANYKGSCTTNYVNFEGMPAWTYVCNKVPYINCGALGLLITSGRISQVYDAELMRTFFPHFVLKSHASNQKFASLSTIEINAFECEWAQVIIRHNKTVLGISPIVSLRATLCGIAGVISLHSSFSCECHSCQEVRDFVLGTHSLTNLSAEVVKRNIIEGRQNAMQVEECVRGKVFLE